jgi:ribokinase
VSDSTPAATPHDVVIVGVANVDLVTHVPQLPAPGETAFGSELAVLPGGKGLNQAITVAQHGGNTALVASAGDDPWGRLLLQALRDADVDTSAFALVPHGKTAGVLIHVPASGDSAVTVTRTATTFPELADIDRAQSQLHHAATVIVQLELAPDVIARTLTNAPGIKIGMLAPQNPLPASTMQALDLIVVNASEAALMLDQPRPETAEAVARLASDLMQLGPSAAVVTMGPAGAGYSDRNSTRVVASPRARVTDSTGAGDAFLGVLGLTLAKGGQLDDAVAAGVVAGSHAVQHHGAVQIGGRRPRPKHGPTRKDGSWVSSFDIGSRRILPPRRQTHDQ